MPNCPQCHQCTDATMLADHGICFDCHKAWQHADHTITDEYPHGNKYPRLDDNGDLPPGKPAGLYLRLFNGHTINSDPETWPDDWGFEGPLIGPLFYVQTTYNSELKCEPAPGFTLARQFPPENREDDELYVLGIDKDGYLNHDGCGYGDWIAFYHTNS